ncbi:hypothetical membrane protein [Brevibacillus brevis NBRC 100599]|uniref:Hypothetical membrane protein n=1 Tax=Brevibacillus brevis (strain 47 / JCM 6285 / NBRC 100599) TaxID=358681 RepID=C0ZEE6_BREBN|nr:hypothetical membrane protein [Brevibacillus brevis NBRC 100599]
MLFSRWFGTFVYTWFQKLSTFRLYLHPIILKSAYEMEELPSTTIQNVQSLLYDKRCHDGRLILNSTTKRLEDFSVKSLRTFAKWVMIVGLCLMFVSSGIYKLIGHPEATLAFQGFGFPPWFQVVIGLGEVLGGLGLLMKKSSRYAAYTLAVIMLGATVTLLLHGDTSTVVIPLVLLFVFLLIGLRRFNPSAR